MKELSIEEKAKRYDEAIKRLEDIKTGKCQKTFMYTEGLFDYIFPELKENADERMKRVLTEGFAILSKDEEWYGVVTVGQILAWFEKQREQKSNMIQWRGNNLKEVIKFTGKDRNFDKWFNSFEEYEKYVHAHDNIFKIFNEDGSHYEVPVGAWIIKTPDGCNIASKAIFVQNSSWNEEDEAMLDTLIANYEFLCKKYRDEEHDFFVGMSLVKDDLNMVSWLKTLKERVQSHPKQEWSQTDNELADDAIACVTRCYEKYKDNKEFYQSLRHNTLDIKRWLIDVRRRITPHWKPSDEQMKQLGWVAEQNKYNMIGKELMSLYQDLKKLREE